MKSIFTFIFLFFAAVTITAQNPIEGFTHPFAKFDESISLYYEPYKYKMELYIEQNEEAGYIVLVKQKKDNFLNIDFLNDIHQTGWVHIGDVGVVIQNYSSNEIPIYSKADSTSCLITKINKSFIGMIYDYDDNYVCVELIDPYYSWEKTNIIGWVERKYTCGNPYTTCP